MSEGGVMERHVVVLSDDMNLRGEVEAAIAHRPGVRAVFAGWRQASHWRLSKGDQVVVVDDEGQLGAVRWVEEAKAHESAAAIIYLAAQHTLELERQARRAGASYYTAKSARGHDLTRVIEAMLRTTGP